MHALSEQKMHFDMRMARLENALNAHAYATRAPYVGGAMHPYPAPPLPPTQQHFQPPFMGLPGFFNNGAHAPQDAAQDWNIGGPNASTPHGKSAFTASSALPAKTKDLF
jgi:hypothetical protein